MAAPEDVDVDQWITDARQAGLPVLIIGVTLLVVVLGIPLTIAGTLVLLSMFMAQLVAVKRLFVPPETD